MDSIVLAGGCFWCLEAAYSYVEGVVTVEPGYAGGREEEASYEVVSSGRTSHAEAVRINFDSEVISLKEVMDIFWVIHDPTTINRQGNDVGPQYRSAIFYRTDGQMKAAEESIKQAQKLFEDPIVTRLEKLDRFYPAENYHRDYYFKNSDKPYCQMVINPKLIKLRQKYASKLKQQL